VRGVHAVRFLAVSFSCIDRVGALRLEVQIDLGDRLLGIDLSP